MIQRALDLNREHVELLEQVLRVLDVSATCLELGNARKPYETPPAGQTTL
jgi:hypothetical protein